MNILLDMDGVLANFVRGCCRACGRDDSKIIETWPPEEWNLDVVLKMPIEELWKYVNEGGSNFWATLDEYEWAKELYVECKKRADVYFLTAPSTHPLSLAGQLEWIYKFTGDSSHKNYLMGSPKFLCAKPDNVLIDDSDKNCNNFIKAGGKAILVPQPWNKQYSFKGPKVQYVMDQFDNLKT